MIYVIGTPIAAILSALTGWLSGMMAVDMGGLINKSAYIPSPTNRCITFA